MDHERLQFRRIESVVDSIEYGGDLPPYCIEIHPTDLCNQNCGYCFNREELNRDKVENGILSLQDYIEIFQEAESMGISEVSVSGGGEPFLGVDILGILDWLGHSSLRTRIVTNGSVMPDEVINSVLSADEIRFSIDAMTPETYRSQRGLKSGRMFYKTMSNLRKLVAERNNCGSQLKIGATFLISSINLGEFEDFAHVMLSDVGIDKVVYKYDIYDPECSPDDNQLRFTLRRLSDTYGDSIEYRGGVDKDCVAGACAMPYFKAAFNPFGDLYACCLGSQPGEKDGIKLGSIKASHGFRDLWQACEPIRRNMLLGRGVDCINCNVTDQAINLAIRSIIKSKTNLKEGA